FERVWRVCVVHDNLEWLAGVNAFHAPRYRLNTGNAVRNFIRTQALDISRQCRSCGVIDVKFADKLCSYSYRLSVYFKRKITAVFAGVDVRYLYLRLFTHAIAEFGSLCFGPV